MHNIISLTFRSTEKNGWPRARIYLDDKLLQDYKFNQNIQVINIPVTYTPSKHTVRVDRTDKTHHDQILEITAVSVDGVMVPDHLIRQCCEFEYNDIIDKGSTYFGPDGTWRFFFHSPIITYLLDLSIHHEAIYSDNYKYPWSYQLGPGSTDDIIQGIDKLVDKVNIIL